MERSRPTVGPLVGFAFVGKVVVGWMDLIESAAVAMEFEMDVGFELEVGLVVPLGFVMPLEFVVPQCFETLAARTPKYAEVLLWRLLPSEDTTHETAAFEDTLHLNRQSVEAAHVVANTLFPVHLAGNLLPCRRALIRAATATSH